MKNALKILTISALLILNFNLKSQCTQVCGTVTAKGTITTTPGGTQSVTPTAGSTFTVQQKAGTTFTTTYSGTQTVNINNTSFSVTGTPTVHVNNTTFTTVPSGTTTTIGTVTVTPTGNYTVATTYSYVTAAGSNPITAGALSVSISNVGNSAALFNTITLPAGATVNILIPNTTLPAYTYDCQTSILTVLVNR